ncbi:chaperone modulator CbpM [Oceaniglobus indicus]|uniref:chaperone modulator CbpM n=1 Tax=Oceaniglobus indicus TaxID=2047749 RepID=UPI000C19C425|nr:chaperone modulator CbpM [Oceaniglobus indicus]
MSELLSEDEVIATVTRLTRSRLVRFVEGEFVKPERAAHGYVFRRVDIARLELLCDLSLDLEFDETALGTVLSLLDQLHAARQDLAAMAHAIDTLPESLRTEILTALKKA